VDNSRSLTVVPGRAFLVSGEDHLRVVAGAALHLHVVDGGTSHALQVVAETLHGERSDGVESGEAVREDRALAVSTSEHPDQLRAARA